MLAPIAVTALAVLVLLPFTGLMDFGQVVSTGFGDSTFAFFLGVLLLSAAFQKTHLGRRIALVIFRIFGCKPRCVLFGLMLAGMLLAMWVTEVASAAILYPLALSIVEQSRGRADHSTLARVLMLGVAWGPAFGGVATPIATGANLVAVNYLEQYAGITVSFGRWMSIGLPIAVTLLAAGWFLLAREIPRDAEALQMEGNIPPFSRKEAFLLADFLLAVLLWVLGDKVGLSSHHVALLAGLVLFLPGIDVLDWKDTVRSISWDSIILICSGIVLGQVLYQYGVAEWMVYTGAFTAGPVSHRRIYRAHGIGSENPVQQQHSGRRYSCTRYDHAGRAAWGQRLGFCGPLYLFFSTIFYRNNLQPRQCDTLCLRLLYPRRYGQARDGNDAACRCYHRLLADAATGAVSRFPFSSARHARPPQL